MRVLVTDAFMGQDITAAFTEAGMDVADRRDLTAAAATADLIKEAGRVWR
jgi:hypothetical protein